MTSQPGISLEGLAVALRCAKLICPHCAMKTPRIEFGYTRVVYHIGDDGLSECAALPILRAYGLLPETFK